MKDAADYLTGIKPAAPSNGSVIFSPYFQPLFSAITKSLQVQSLPSHIVFPLLPWSVP
ncbi:hypothetical protein [Janthinobacterium sp. FT14W]|uniref:hypothetical protein n=1 Tax=Janthinobacterium sp. FT14W TaxID=2654253 RepID=UPI00186B45EF|nr:hypothetical protein [Janthinobacterium sp. FT14W]